MIAETELDFFGTKYLVDVDYSYLIKKSDPFERALFKYMQYYGGGYLAAFDLDRKCLVSIEDEDNRREMPVEIPEMCKLDRAGMLRKWGYEKDDPKLIHDSDFRGNAELFKRRQSGELPQIEIEGKWYQIDWENTVLVSQGNENPAHDETVDLLHLGCNWYRTELACFYDLIEKRVVCIVDQDAKIPPHFIGIQIPGPAVLDPYLLSFKPHLRNDPVVVLGEISPPTNPTSLPIKMELHARIVELTDDWKRQTIDTTRTQFIRHKVPFESSFGFCKRRKGKHLGR